MPHEARDYIGCYEVGDSHCEVYLEGHYIRAYYNFTNTGSMREGVYIPRYATAQEALETLIERMEKILWTTN